MWLVYAICRALFATLTAITVKKNVKSNLGTAIRTFVVLFFKEGINFKMFIASILITVETILMVV